jgi:signal transduction histidine kinase
VGTHKRLEIFLGFSLVMAGLAYISTFNYLLFHGLVELFSIIVAAGMFIIAWNTRRIIQNNYLLLVGLAYLFVGGLDLLHTLSYKGMGVFPGRGANLPTQLWIAARYLEAGSLLAGPFFLGRRLRPARALWLYGALTLLLTGLIFSGSFPDCFVEGTGLTPFKKGSEYLISVTLVLAMLALWRRAGDFEPSILKLLSASLLFTIAAALAFTFYISVYVISNVTGHLFKLVSFYLIYKALIASGLESPYNLLFRNLKKSEEALAEDNAKLLAMQKEIMTINSRLKELNEQKNRFVGIAAHDIRSPLAIVRLYSQILRERLADAGDGEGMKLVDVIDKSIESMLNMVTNLLDISSIEAGKLMLEVGEVDFAELVRNRIAVTSILAARKNISISFNDPDGVPPVRMDSHRMNQVLDNLLGNAVKYSPPQGSVEVLLERRSGEVILSVQDNGMGIPESEMEKLFQPFGRTSARSTGGERSTGLGLAIVKKIVEAHGGRVWAESRAGEWSRFSAALPARAAVEPGD